MLGLIVLFCRIFVVCKYLMVKSINFLYKYFFCLKIIKKNYYYYDFKMN